MKVVCHKALIFLAILTFLFLTMPNSGFTEILDRYSISTTESAVENLEPVGKSHIAKSGWEVTPMLGVEEIYSTNIFGRDDIEDRDEEDFISAVALGLQLKLGSANRYIFMKHIGVAYDYHENPRFNHQKYSGEMSFNMASPGGFLFNVREHYKYSPSPPFSQYTYERTYYDNNASASIGYMFADVYIFRITYQNFIRRYKEDEFDDGDFRRDSWILTGAYNFSPKTAFMILYKLDSQTYSNVDDDDFYRHTAQGGLKWGITGRLTGHLMAGYTQKELKDSISGRDDTCSTWSVDVDLTEKFSSYTTMILRLSRSIETEENNQTVFSTNATEINTSGELSAKHFLLKQIFIGAKVGIEDIEFEDDGIFENKWGALYNKKREDTFVILGANVGYDNSDWLTTEVGYEYRDNDSNIDGLSYTDNRISLQVNLSY